MTDPGLQQEERHSARLEVLPNGNHRSTCSCGWESDEYEAQPEPGARLAALMGVGHVNEKECADATRQRDQRIKDLELYAQHKPGCTHHWGAVHGFPHHCDCGLASLLEKGFVSEYLNPDGAIPVDELPQKFPEAPVTRCNRSRGRGTDHD